MSVSLVYQAKFYNADETPSDLSPLKLELNVSENSDEDICLEIARGYFESMCTPILDMGRASTYRITKL